MSLVNDMLRDLDRRNRADYRQGAINTVFGGQEPARRRGGLLLIGIAVLGAVLGLAAAWLYFERAPAPPPAVVPAGSEVAGASRAPDGPAEPAAGTRPAAAAQVPELIRVNVVQSALGFALTAFFTDDIAYEMLQRAPTVLNLVIPQARLAADFEHAGLEGLDLMETAAGLNLNLATVQGAEFSVGVNNDSLMPSLMIEVIPRVAVTLGAALPSGAAAASPQVQTASTVIPYQEPVAPPAPPQSQALVDPAPALPSAPPPEASMPSARGAPAPMQGRQEQGRTTRTPSFEERDREASQTAVARAQGGQMLEAYGLLLEFVSANPEAHQSRETLVTLMIGRQEFAQARALLADGLALAPAHAGFRKLQARLHMEQGEPLEALTLLRRQPPTIQEDPEYHDLLAALLQQAGDHAGAITAYQALLRSDPRQARWWTAMAISHEALGNLREAMASYQAAAQIPNIDPRLKQYSQDRINSLRLRL